MWTVGRSFFYYTTYLSDLPLVSGCLSPWDAPSGSMAALSWDEHKLEFSTGLAPPQRLWAQPITVQFQQADLSLYPGLSRPTSGSSAQGVASETGSARPAISIISTLAASTTTITSSQDSAGVRVTISPGQTPPAAATTTTSGQDTLVATPTTTSGQRSPPAAADDGLSQGAKTGIGVGVSLAILLIVGIVGLKIWHKRRAKAKIAYEDLAAEEDGEPVTEKDGKEIIGELLGD